jgi:hypothetical protein
MNGPSIIVLLILLIGLVGPLKLSTHLLFILSVFSAMAVPPPSLLGGTSLTPGSLAILFFLLRAIAVPDILKRSFVSLYTMRQLGWLGGFFVVSAIGAIVLPRIFEGEISVYGLRVPRMTTVEPTLTNFTQLGYLFLSVFTAAVICALLRKKPQFIETVLKGIFAGGVALIATGLIDIIANASGHASLLKMFYTAEYGYSAGEILGARRVLGLTPEPSAFGALATYFGAMLLFFRPVFPPQLWRWKVPAIGWGCIIMGFLSESSATYLSMFVFLGIYIFYDAHVISEDGVLIRKTAVQKMLWLAAILCVLPAILLLESNAFASFGEMVDTLIFKKTDSSSFVERSSWTAAGIKAFVESFGLGVGVGSVRTSNFFANILGSTGLPGSVLFMLFITFLYTRHAAWRNSKEEAIIRAAKLALIPMLADLFLVGTTPDFGLCPGVLFGIIAGTASHSASRNPA